ncbi:odorant receptor 10-like isoform X2 [Nomia melanderi]|uniref:odorant receptor 10-like isoform X2 n=1 Tax=Nomia melanderi TaxID=2448451 RepID=UPI003FCD39C3
MSSSKSVKRAGYEWAVGVSRFFLKLICLWPEDTHGVRRFMENLFINTLVVLFICFMMIPTMLFVRKLEQFTAIVDNLVYPCTVFTITWKVFIFHRNRDDMMAEDWSKPRTDEETSVMLHYANIVRVVNVCAFAVVFFAVLCADLFPIFGVNFRYTSPLSDVFPIPTYYEYDVYHSPYYEMIYVVQVILMWFLLLGYCSVDMVFGMVVFHICGQVKNFRTRIAREKEFENFKHTLTAIVTDHIRLSRAVDKIENLFKLILLAQMLLFGIMLCVYGSGVMAAITENSKPSLTRIIYLICLVTSCIMQISFYFITGQILANQSEALYYAVYECEWIKLKSNEVRSLILVMMRAKQPFLITTEKLFPMTLMTFGNIIKICFSYVSFILARL